MIFLSLVRPARARRYVRFISRRAFFAEEDRSRRAGSFGRLYSPVTCPSIDSNVHGAVNNKPVQKCRPSRLKIASNNNTADLTADHRVVPRRFELFNLTRMSKIIPARDRSPLPWGRAFDRPGIRESRRALLTLSRVGVYTCASIDIERR